MLIAQISDLHLRLPGERAYAGLDIHAMAERAVDAVTALDPAPDCLLVTGDVADGARPEAYAAALDLLSRLPVPVFVIPGNHDRREVMRECLAGAYPYLLQTEGFLNYVVEDFAVRLIGLDTVIPGGVGGEICAEREKWLAARLAEGDGRPTLIFMHHPPFATGIDGMDGTMCRVSNSFEQLVEGHPEIERVVAGHHHRPVFRRWAGTIGFIVPGVAHQLALDLRPGEPVRYVHEPPAFALHDWTPSRGMVSHIVPIGGYGPNHNF